MFRTGSWQKKKKKRIEGDEMPPVSAGLTGRGEGEKIIIKELEGENEKRINVHVKYLGKHRKGTL